MQAYPVAKTAEIPVNTFKIVEIEGRSIGVYNVKGQYYAVHNYCPHQGAELCKGPVCGTTLDSAVFEYAYGREQEIVRCPWHGWEFDLQTGKSLFSDKVRVRSYQIVVENDTIGIILGASGKNKEERA